MKTTVVLTRPNGGCGYVVARFDGVRMRIAHPPDLASARVLEREWNKADFSFDPGVVRALKYFEPTPKPTEIAHHEQILTFPIGALLR